MLINGNRSKILHHLDHRTHQLTTTYNKCRIAKSSKSPMNAVLCSFGLLSHFGNCDRNCLNWSRPVISVTYENFNESARATFRQKLPIQLPPELPPENELGFRHFNKVSVHFSGLLWRRSSEVQVK